MEAAHTPAPRAGRCRRFAICPRAVSRRTQSPGGGSRPRRRPASPLLSPQPVRPRRRAAWPRGSRRLHGGPSRDVPSAREGRPVRVDTGLQLPAAVCCPPGRTDLRLSVLLLGYAGGAPRFTGTTGVPQRASWLVPTASERSQQAMEPPAASLDSQGAVGGGRAQQRGRAQRCARTPTRHHVSGSAGPQAAPCSPSRLRGPGRAHTSPVPAGQSQPSLFPSGPTCVHGVPAGSRRTSNGVAEDGLRSRAQSLGGHQGRGRKPRLSQLQSQEGLREGAPLNQTGG